MNTTIGIELDIMTQFWKDYPKVAMLERVRRGSPRLWVPVNPLPPAWDNHYEEWQAGDTIGDAGAIEQGSITPLYTVSHLAGGYVTFVGRNGKKQTTAITNMRRIQERIA